MISTQISEAQYQQQVQPVDRKILSAKDALLQWARQITAGYPNVNVTNFTGSWKDGLAFCAILHYFRPGLVNWEKVFF